MHQRLRKLIILSSLPLDSELVQEFSSEGWNVHAVYDKNQASLLLARGEFHIGLAITSLHDQDRLPSWMVDIISTYSKTKWIMVLPKHWLQQEAISALISERCYDYHTLPIDQQRLLFSLGHAYGMVELAKRWEQQPYEAKGQFGMIGTSPAMQALFYSLQKATSVDVPALITGESGTGKELAARAIHEHSPRAAKPFLVFNCSALPATSILSELFGDEKGAFTGAHEPRPGCIELAAMGTLFLREISDLPLDIQSNLVHFLDQKTIKRIGGHKPIKVDTRIIAATSVNLEQAIQAGRFREDLYYRLNVLHLHIPSLRDREEDIQQLAQFFFANLAQEMRTAARGLSQESLKLINSYTWPGNVLELQNRMRQAALMSKGPYITPTDLGLERRSARRGLTTLSEFRLVAEREAIHSALRRNRSNHTRAAQELGIARMTLYRLMEKYGMKNIDQESTLDPVLEAN